MTIFPESSEIFPGDLHPHSLAGKSGFNGENVVFEMFLRFSASSPELFQADCRELRAQSADWETPWSIHYSRHLD